VSGLAAGGAPGGAFSRRPARLAAATALFGIALSALAAQGWLRGVEAQMAGWTVHQVLGFSVMVARATQTFYFQYHDRDSTPYLGLQISLACSSILLVVPAFLVSGLLAVLGSVPLLRLVLGLAAFSAVVVAVNLLRLVLISILVDAWGEQSGFGWAHTFFGSVLTLAGLSAAAYAYYRVVRAGATVPTD
jgi:exosortase/archaeosortase family protein